MESFEDIINRLEVLPSQPAPQSDSFVSEGCFEDAAAAKTFILAGNATVTLVSKKSKERFTFRVRASEDGQVHFVSLLNGPDNESQYAYFGYIRREVFFHGGRKAKVAYERPCVQGFKWAWENLVKGGISPSLEIWHEGRCGRCARKLTVPSSIASGFGPECEGKVFG